MTQNIAILGASGYTGAELVRLIATHPSMRIAALSGERKAGQAMAEVFPHLRHLDLPVLRKIEEIDFAGIDLAFCALPHATSQAVITSWSVSQASERVTGRALRGSRAKAAAIAAMPFAFFVS